MPLNQNHIAANLKADVMFIDMNSFFASCEQQVNYYLRNRPVAVCVYPGRTGCIISPSVEAKKRGVKTGMRLNDAMKICPDLIPLETRPDRYREYHVKIMEVLRQYSQDVIPKSIDEAIVNFSGYQLVYKDLSAVARKIKYDIKSKVGDWLRCSIGIAPNAFLAKLGSDIQKPDGLVVITPDNIDGILKKLTLTDLPGIASKTAERLQKAGIKNPFQLRHTSPAVLHRACNSVVGEYWHYRLNFSEVDFAVKDYQSMQAMRQISMSQRQSLQTLKDLFVSLCTTLEKRMVKQGIYCKEIGFNSSYEDGKTWKTHIHCDAPVQEGTRLLGLIEARMKKIEKEQHSGSILSKRMTSMGVSVWNFVPEDVIQLSMFEDNVKQHNLRKTLYEIKQKFGNDKIIKAAELQDEPVMKDAIGFGSVKDMY